MAYTFVNNNDASISFNEFIESLNKIIKFGKEESILDCVKYLALLANNDNFFLDFLNMELTNNILNFQSTNTYSEQSFILYDCDDYYVRMTFWPVLSNNVSVRNSQNQLFSYGLVHDHNFSLLTAGYKGDGYTTKIWEYDYDKVIGIQNEEIDITFLEETILTKGKIMYYRPSKDIHAQFPPIKEDSLAINIILKSLKQFDNRQYEFDINRSRIKKILYGSAASKFGLIQIAKYSHNLKTIDILHSLATNCGITQVRKESLEVLAAIEDYNDVWEIGLKDKDNSVIEYSKSRLLEKS